MEDGQRTGRFCNLFRWLVCVDSLSLQHPPSRDSFSVKPSSCYNTVLADGSKSPF
jgi:hypothetical protein